ncbi:TRAP transporter small permease [Halomonas sp. THAF12]|uniref:TRAP transporter small permease n=1 Tax=Halomonas sp. B23F22_10 TaxID=3459515 RepID=UPI00373EA3B1
MLEFFLRFERVMTRFSLVVAVLMLIISVTTGFYQVMTRFVFDAPSTWSEVVARSSMIWCVFLAAASGFRGGGMMSVEVIYKLVPRKSLILIEALVAVGCVIALAILVYYGTAMTLRVRSQMLSGLGVSIAWVYAAIPVGAGFALLAVVARLLAQASGREAVGMEENDEAESLRHDEAESASSEPPSASSTLPRDRQSRTSLSGVASPAGSTTRRARS